MKTREEQIVEMAKEMRNYGYEHLCEGRVFYYGFCEKLYDAGYRKQSDTAREFVDKVGKIAFEMHMTAKDVYQGRNQAEAQQAYGATDAIKKLMAQIIVLAAEYGVEVEE